MEESARNRRCRPDQPGARVRPPFPLPFLLPSSNLPRARSVDLLRHLFGNIVRVFCELGPSTRGHDVEETGACTLKFENGMVGTFVFSEYVSQLYNLLKHLETLLTR